MKRPVRKQINWGEIWNQPVAQEEEMQPAFRSTSEALDYVALTLR